MRAVLDERGVASGLTLRSLRARPVNVPLKRPLQTSGGAVETAPLVLIDLETNEGVSGCSYVFVYAAMALRPVVALLDALGEILMGDQASPAAIEAKLQRRFALVGPYGLTGMAAAGVDMACWDLLAKATKLPLVRLLGGEPRPIPAYNSCGLGIIGQDRAGAEAQELVAPGFGAVKVRLGYPTPEEDLRVVRRVRQSVGQAVLVMSDYNQCLTVAEAVRRAATLDDEGLYWIEEPTRFDDYEGHAQIARETKTPIQLGENCSGPHEVARALAAKAGDYLMPDVVKVGGITRWLRAAALAEPAGVPISGHLYPEVSVHLLGVAPTSHWLEYVDWADPVLEQPLVVRAGQALIPERPGIGLAWNEPAVERFLVK